MKGVGYRESMCVTCAHITKLANTSPESIVVSKIECFS